MSITVKQPLYYRLKQTILKWIESGTYLPGALIPSEKQLQEMYDISRTTVRLALKELEQEGLVVRSPGKGTFVAKLKVESGPRRLLSFTEEMNRIGLHTTNVAIALQKERGSGRIMKLLGLTDGQELWHWERVRLADGEPIVTEMDYVPANLVPEMNEGVIRNRSFYEYLEQQYGIIIAYAQERVECRAANTRESKRLNLPKGAPILFIERVTYAYRKNRPMESFPLEFVKMSYNASKYSFNQIIRKE